MRSGWGSFASRHIPQASPAKAHLEGLFSEKKAPDGLYGQILDGQDPNGGSWEDFVTMSPEAKGKDLALEPESRQWRADWNALNKKVNEDFGGNWKLYADAATPGAVPVYPEMWLIGGTKAAPATAKLMAPAAKAAIPAAKAMAPAAKATASAVGKGLSAGWDLYSGNAMKRLGGYIGGKVGPRTGDALGETMAWAYRGMPTAYTGAALAANTSDKDPEEYMPGWAWDAANKAGLLSIGSLLSYPLAYLMGRNDNIRNTVEGETVNRLANYADKKMRGVDVPLGPRVGGKSLFQQGWGEVGADMISDAKGTMDELADYMSGEKDESQLSESTRRMLRIMSPEKMEKLKAGFGAYAANREDIQNYGRVGTDVMLGAPIVARAYEHGMNAMDRENPARSQATMELAREINNAIPVGKLMYDDIKRISDSKK
jgi:hypothetical protein